VDAVEAPLPDRVRARVVDLAADALGRIDRDGLSPGLRRVSSFTPGKRARLAGSQIAGALEHPDAVLRQQVAADLRTRLPGLVSALDAGTVPAAADPVDVAAVVYLVRPPGWVALLESAVAALGVERGALAERETRAQVDRLRGRLESVTDELAESRSRHREQLARVKTENAELRHRLGDTRTRLRAAETAAATAVARAEDAVREAATTTAALETELRRLRARGEQLEQDLAGVRRAERGQRGSEALRARLLLDTLLDTAQGLRRELALPAVEGAPADAVAAHVAEQGVRTSSSHGSLAVDDPALLEQLLLLPRVHLIVDGYNVTKTAWPQLSLERQRDRLVGSLPPLVSRSGAEVTVVFDAADSRDRPPVSAPRGLRVLFSPVGVIADDVIRELVAAEPRGRPLVVVSSDNAVVRDVVAAGARVAAAAALHRLLGGG
jgi:predicted RNA-binding protein with PIN domain